ncbi:MAG TPA: putative O-glycosylation ligase, exosortase A system-associated [Allosphingosinicella sp.]|jgi:probable O-glycosylation ligase (exosortase A-associated)|nr:putative O-glycosylation ligase, exosortase A system-associated [Allosphingosinicella sp.]
MRDLAFVGFLLAILMLGFRRPFLFVLVYAYIDTVAPQRLSYYLLNSLPISMIVACLAFAGWLLVEKKTDLRIGVRQALMGVLLCYSFYTTANADFPVAAAEKWDWASTALAFTIFVPLTLRSKLRIEALLLFLTLSAAAIIIVGGLKTVAAGGGYGVLNLMVTDNSNLYESSTISTIAIALIPIILWLAKFGTVFPPDWRVKAFAAALVFACLLMPIGTEARTGLICIAVLGLLTLRNVKRRFLYVLGASLLVVAAIPFLPQSFTGRMSTIQGYQSDSSAKVRLAVWGWTWNYVQEHPLGGGFGAYRGNKIEVKTVVTQGEGGVQTITARTDIDQGRAYHSAYFEMLGEQGFPGLALFLLIHIAGIVRMEMLRRRYRKEEGEKAWISPLATALQHFQIIYLVGASFVAIAYQPFTFMILGVQIGLDAVVARRERAERPRAAFAPAAARPQPGTAPA